MGKQVKIKFNSKGFREILLSGEVQQYLAGKAAQIRDRANANNTRGGEGWTDETFIGKYGGGRWVAVVKPLDDKAIKAESEDKALSRAWP